MLDVEMLVTDDIEFAADWRREKAQEFPNDAHRNLNAAAALDRIAADLRKLKGSQLHWRVQAACARNVERYGEILSQMIRAVGFRSSVETGAEFLAEFCFLVEGFKEEGGVVHRLAD